MMSSILQALKEVEDYIADARLQLENEDWYESKEAVDKRLHAAEMHVANLRVKLNLRGDLHGK